jgi:hypothetical protein
MLWSPQPLKGHTVIDQVAGVILVADWQMISP